MKQKRIIFILLTALFGCQTAQMQIQPELAVQSEVLQVSGRQGFKFEEDFWFSPFSVENVQRGWKKTETIGFSKLTHSSSSQGFQFIIRDASQAWHGSCATNLNISQADFEKVLGGAVEIELYADTSLICNFTNLSSNAKWTLAMNQQTDAAALAGMLTNGVERLNVKATTNLQGSSFSLTEASGYYFYSSQQPIAAVETINQGRVFLPKTAPQYHSALAAASAALLLYRDFRS